MQILLMKSVKVFIKREGSVIVESDWIETVQLLADGYEISEVANKLSRNRRTLETKIRYIKMSLGCNTLSHLVAFFFRKKLIK